MQTLLDEISRLVTEGGKIAMNYHGKLESVDKKADDSPLTAADLAVDEYLCAELEKSFPDIPVVTEERAASHAREFAGEKFFLVDPIDGTKEFVAERGEFTINIALIENGQPVLGAVCAPAVGRLFAGGHDCIATHTSLSDGVQSALTPKQPDNEALVVVASRSHLNAETQQFIDANKVAQTTNAGSSLKFCLLAAGEADLYPRFGPTMEWDTAAGHAVLLSAHGLVEEISGAPLIYGKADYRNPHFIAYTAGTKFIIPAN